MEQFSFSSWLAEGGSNRLRSFSLSKSYSRISWVFACNNVIATSISGVRLLFTDLEDNLIDSIEHPVRVLFDKPNPPDVPALRALLSQTFTLLGIDGIVFWVFKRVKGRWTNIAVKKNWQMKPVFKEGRDSALLGWVEVDRYQRTKNTYGYKEVLPIRYYNPYDPLGGMAPLTAARLGIEQEFNMAAWNASFFASGLRSPIGVSYKRQLGAKQKKDLQKNIRDYYSGVEGGQGVFILEGDGTFTELGMTAAKDLDFVEGKQMNREEICAVYGVPPAVVGIFRYANYANCEVQRKLLWENCLLPKMESLLDLINTNIMDEEFRGVKAKWDIQSIAALKKDFKEVATAAKIYFDMGYNRQEVAVILDTPELNPEPAEPPEPPPEEEPIEEEETGSPFRLKYLMPRTSDLDIVNIKADEPWWFEYGVAYESLLTSLEQRWLNYLGRFVADLGRSLYRKVAEGRPAVLNPMLWEEPWEGMAELLIRDTCELAAKVTIGELNTNGDLEELGKILRNTRVKNSAVDSIDLSRYMSSSELAAFNSAIKSYAAKTVGVSSEIIAELNKRAVEELAAGATPNQLRMAVSKIVNETYRGRSLTIARTISGGAYNSARFDTFQTMNVQKHRWVNAGDNIVRPTHLQEGGHVAVVGEAFPVTHCRYPLDPLGKAKEVINCRCTTFPVKHKAPRRSRPVSVPEKAAAKPMITTGRGKVTSNLMAKVDRIKGHFKPGRVSYVQPEQFAKLEGLAEELIDNGLMKAAEYSSKELNELAAKFGNTVTTKLPGLTRKGKDALTKHLLAGVNKSDLTFDRIPDVKVRINSRMGSLGQYEHGQKTIALSKQSAAEVIEFFNAVGSGGNVDPDWIKSVQTLCHEWGHHIQDWRSGNKSWAGMFYRNRTQGEKLKIWHKMRDVKVREDKWARKYQGRQYTWESGKAGTGVEVMSCYNEVVGMLPWSEDFRVLLLSNRALKKAWARYVLNQLAADPDGCKDVIKLIKGL